MSDAKHGLGCCCTGNPWLDRYDCPWYATEVDVSSIPTSLGACRICFAALPDPDAIDHMRWHERMGHLEEIR